MSSSVLFGLSSPPLLLSLSCPSLFLPFYLTSLHLLVSLSLLKPKCCCEGREPLKSEWPLPLGRRRGRGEPQETGGAAGYSQERQTEPRMPPWALRPQRSHFLCCLPSPTWEMKLLGWATEAAETRLFQGSRVPCLGSGGVVAPPTRAPMEPGMPSTHPRQNVSISAEPTPCPYPTSDFVRFYFLKRKDWLAGRGPSPRVETGPRAPERIGRTFEQSQVKGIATKNPSEKTGSMEGMVEMTQ